MTSRLYRKFRSLFPFLIGLYVPTLILVGFAVFVSIQNDIPISRFMRDPAAILGSNPLLGVFSNIGVLLWSVCAGICLFTFAVLRTRANKEEWSPFFFFAGLITAVLLMDDFFLLHERIVPRYLKIDEDIISVLYVVMILGYLVRFRRWIVRTDYVLLLLALVLFGLSGIVDRLPETRLEWHHLFEDGFKLFGIVSWFGYFVRSAFRVVTSVMVAERREYIDAP